MDFWMWHKSQTKINNLYLTNCNGSVTVLLHNAGQGPFLVFGILGIYVKKPPVCLQRSKNGNSDAYLFIFLNFVSFPKNSNKFSSIKKPLSHLYAPMVKVFSLWIFFLFKAWELLLVSFFIFIHDNKIKV